MNQETIYSILDEPEFKENGMVWKHIKSGRSDHMIAVRTAVDRMRELHDIEDRDFNDICFEVLKGIQARVGGF